jgi:hypothetical protein
MRLFIRMVQCNDKTIKADFMTEQMFSLQIIGIIAFPSYKFGNVKRSRQLIVISRIIDLFGWTYGFEFDI